MEARAQQHTIGSAIQHVKDYVDASVKLAKMKAADKTSTAITNTAAYTAAAVLGLFVLLFGSITLALALGNWLGSNIWGFLIVTVLYAVLVTVILLTKDKLIKMPVLNMLLKKMFKEGNGYGSGKEHQTI